MSLSRESASLQSFPRQAGLLPRMTSWILVLFVYPSLMTYDPVFGLTDTSYPRPVGPTWLSRPPGNVVFANTKGIAISCTASGTPAPELDWVKDDGEAVVSVAGLVSVLANNTLYFHAFHSTLFDAKVHKSIYKCLATNAGGTIVSSNVSVKAVLVEQYTNYDVSLNDMWVMRGSTAVLRCVINPPYVTEYVKVIGWTRGDMELRSDGRVSILQDGVLHIRNVQDEDTGMLSLYTCVTRNILTGENRTSKSATIRIHEPPAGGERPIIHDSLPSVTISQGESIELPCVASQAYPSPRFTWKKDTITLAIDGWRLAARGGNLLIRNATVYDSGEYICISTNNHAHDSSITHLTVTSPLSVLIEPSDQIVDAGHSARFNCTTYGHPINTINWFINGHPIKTSSRIYFENNVTLVVKEVTRSDQGMYQCFIGNDRDSAQGAGQLSLGAAQPAWLDGFQEQFVQTGQKVTLHCRFSGNPIPQVTWSLDGADLPLDHAIAWNSFVTTEGDIMSFVNISSVVVALGGEYTCYGVSKVGLAKHTNRLNVYGSPFIKPMPNVTATASKDLSLRCYVSGYPLDSIQWYKGAAQLPINHRQSVLENGTLVIRHVQREDSGQYTCVALNREKQRMERSMHIAVVEPPVIDPFHFRQRKQGDRILVTCAIISGDLPITIQWEKDGRAIPQDLGIRIQQLGDYSILSINGATPRHDGNYTCYVSNAAASVNYTATLHIDVPPRWVMEPEDSFVVLHESVQLDCQADGTPDPRVVWKKAEGLIPRNYQQLTFDTNQDHRQLYHNGTLVINNAREEDHGYYLCQASNGVGFDISKVIHLNVHIPARFNEPRHNYTVMKGQSVTLECQAVGDKPLSISWSFQGSPISTSPTNERAKIVSQSTPRGKLSQLTLTPTTRADSGFYTCNAKNNFGNGVLVNYLVVHEPPEPPGKVTVMNITSRSAVVTWEAPFDGNSPIIGYTVQYKNSTDVWQGVLPNITVALSKQQAILENLLPSFTYHIRVLANNTVGYSEPSEIVEATLQEEAPTGPPDKVTVQAVGSQALKVLWEPPVMGYQNGKILGYYIGYKETQSPAQFIYQTHEVPEGTDPSKSPTEHTIGKLKKFTQYTVHVKAYNIKGISPASTNLNVFTLEDVPSQPPEGVQATPLSSESIKVAWSPPPLFTLHGILQGYKILYKPVRLDEDESDANFQTSSQLEIVLFSLEKFTNYSIQVLAYTRKGEGVRSPPVYVRTREDVPDAPANIKALATNDTAIMISWTPPARPNGIITKYTLYFNNQSSPEVEDVVYELAPNVTNYMMAGLLRGLDYAFRASASTAMGEGRTTKYIGASTLIVAPARIASFSDILTVSWHEDVTLPCITVGKPKPNVQWRLRNQAITNSERIYMTEDGSLHITSVTGTDAANYTCFAENPHGSSQIAYTLRVQVGDHKGTPPHPPHLYLVLTTTTTIQVNWLSGSNGGSPIQGFVLNYKKEHNGWKALSFGPQNRTFIANNLMCGTQYKFMIHAFNKLGDSLDSETVTARTNGSAPIISPQSLLLASVNATSVTLDLSSWQTSGCPIRFFSVKYHVWGDETWQLVNNNIQPNTTLFVVQDLFPATWYIMDVSAHSDAGSTTSQLKFATLTFAGSTIKPLKVLHKQEAEFYEKVYLMVPICAAAVFLFSVVVAMFLFCRRRKDRLRYKEHAANLRRDITAETSLMNDLDKRLNTELDSSSSSTLPEHISKQRNANLLISLQSDDNLPGNSSAWLIDGSNKTTSDNGSFGRSDEGNINPYATYNEIKQTINPEIRTTIPLKGASVPKSSSEEDDIAMQKAAARREMEDYQSKQSTQSTGSTPSEPYVPFFHSKREKQAKYTKKQPPPPLPAPRRAQGCTKDAVIIKEGYDNHGVILSPRRYASADQIHALFSQPSRPHSSMKSGSESTDKGSQRHSLISSVTTVSSSRDELLEALENAKRNPPPPVLYESENDPHPDGGTEGDIDPDSSSQPTDSSVTTEPGIRMFTQSPPKPNEQRQASCEVPPYEQPSQHKRRRPQRMEVESDTNEAPATALRRPLPPRKVRPRHRGKQRGQVTGKRALGTFMPRTQSGTSTTSTNSEEVTYTFGERAQTPRSNSPESYPPYTPAVVTTVQEGFIEYRSETNRAKRGGRRTPHARVRYDTNIQTPGTDDHRPLVTSLAHPALATSPEEEESVSLLDRHYRPVPEEETEMETRTGKEGKTDKGYTEDYTVV
ncbi:cell adhesion molecule DSCAM-like isoform X4 [Biomphalaria glabrata]|uniref:Cell adhesion molecule DSCAM-like isoform X4 n=1 Tax=Biomphalaria glabrata TaxID=6526 RepID=A0A9W2YU36_BIOGL|nr:cell adhesion molecule DSCAM-like isoform X4 [Biomphalaria glabrata]